MLMINKLVWVVREITTSQSKNKALTLDTYIIYETPLTELQVL